LWLRDLPFLPGGLDYLVDGSLLLFLMRTFVGGVTASDLVGILAVFLALAPALGLGPTTAMALASALVLALAPAPAPAPASASASAPTPALAAAAAAPAADAAAAAAIGAPFFLGIDRIDRLRGLVAAGLGGVGVLRYVATTVLMVQQALTRTSSIGVSGVVAPFFKLSLDGDAISQGAPASIPWHIQPRAPIVGRIL
jgi:hypothetical protein